MYKKKIEQYIEAHKQEMLDDTAMRGSNSAGSG